MEQSVKSNSFEKIFFSNSFKKLEFLRKSSKPGQKNIVPMLQVEWNRNFIDVETSFVQVLKNYGFPT